MGIILFSSRWDKVWGDEVDNIPFSSEFKTELQKQSFEMIVPFIRVRWVIYRLYKATSSFSFKITICSFKTWKKFSKERYDHKLGNSKNVLFYWCNKWSNLDMIRILNVSYLKYFSDALICFTVLIVRNFWKL